MATTVNKATYNKAVNTSPFYAVQLRKFATYGLVTMFAVLFLLVYLSPLANMFMVAIRSQEQLSQTADSSIFPMGAKKYEYKGKQLPIFKVEIDGVTRELAQVSATRRSSVFIDPANPEAGEITWEGNWRTLEPVQVMEAHFENFAEAWELINFPRLMGNTLFIAVTGMIGTLLSCICVAYAFARFPIPGKNLMFIILLGTIILPGQVTLIPTYAFFASIKWTGTWLPLIVPHFFANAYNVFLLRQYFLTLPRELDEAAMIDGAGPFRILLNVIIPQSWAAIISVGVFHFVWSWNDFFGPLIYLLGQKELQPVSVGIQVFNFQYGQRPDLIQATSLMAMAIPVIIFFLAQRVFMRGVVITGVEK
ncbi:MAG: carbohydrate ABC transporter permease [Anaerolinea sp.]|nr:carbohydrate ABC transporter permease [Anaerolinea sp.]MCC6974493.1 carbohydrate ABC transporter permease [Anaerolineae bacterium]CAG0997872.1 Diacetylchitobiose uptake system permease protein NgcG [Anaerolineae bacterium]